MKIFKKKILKINLRKFLKGKYLLPALIIVVIAFLITRGGQKAQEIKTTTVERETITAEITASGTVKSQTSSAIKFANSGKIAWVGADEGETVYKGQAIASLEREPFLVALRQAEQEVNAADAILSQVYDEAKKQTAAENFDQKIRRTNAETAKNKAYDAMRKAQFDLDHATIYSPQNGVITNLDVVAGMQVSPADEIAKISDLARLKFVSEVDETDIGQVKIGQEIKLALDAYPDQTIETSVERIAPISTISETGATAYEVTSPLSGTNTYLIGMSGQAQIITKETQDVLTVPQDAIIDEKFVWVKLGPNYVRKEITRGIESSTEVEITSGLSEDEEVIISGFEQIGKRSLLQRILNI